MDNSKDWGEFLPEVPDDKVLALGLVEVCALQGCE